MSKVDHSRYPLPDASYQRRKSTDTLVIHCADTTAKMDTTVNDVREWHIDEHGWLDVGYHLFIKRDGTVQKGRPIWSIGAHVEGHNATSIGICMAGGNGKTGEENNFTPAQWDSLLKLTQRLVDAYTITLVCGHRDFAGVKKYCPSFDVKTWLKDNKKSFGSPQ